MTIGRSGLSIRQKHVAVLALAFFITRILALVAGMRYLTDLTAVYFQVLDLGSLHYRLLPALLYLHAQPPLFNALIGVAEKVGGSHFGQVLLGFQLLVGFCAVVSVYLTLTQLNIPPKLSLLVSFALLFNPAAIGFEFDPLYTELVFALNCFVALAAVCYLKSRSNRALYSFVGTAICLTMVRASYSWIWIVAMLGVLWWQLPENRRQIRNAGFVGLALALLWPAKNYLLFRHFTSSTWLSFSIARHWESEIETQSFQTWIHEGSLPTFTHLEDDAQGVFQSWLRETWPAATTGKPELDDISKKTGGGTNWNSLALLRMHEAQTKDISFLILHDPKAYGVNIARGLGMYFESTSKYLGYLNNESYAQYQHIARIDGMVDRICCNIFGFPPDKRHIEGALSSNAPHASRIQKIQSICMGALLAYGFVFGCLLSFASHSLWNGHRDRKVAAMVMSVTIVYIFLVGNLLEVGENMRFRFETQALVVMVVAIFLHQLWNRRIMAK